MRKGMIMKRRMLCIGLGLALVSGMLGCAQKESETPQETAPAANAPAGGAAVQVAFDPGTVKVGDKAVCVICNAKEGSTAAEEVKETIDYQGKTYAFCNESEKAEFISDPKKYVK
jgi:YHS domain-containing protein